MPRPRSTGERSHCHSQVPFTLSKPEARALWVGWEVFFSGRGWPFHEEILWALPVHTAQLDFHEMAQRNREVS